MLLCVGHRLQNKKDHTIHWPTRTVMTGALAAHPLQVSLVNFFGDC